MNVLLLSNFRPVATHRHACEGPSIKGLQLLNVLLLSNLRTDGRGITCVVLLQRPEPEAADCADFTSHKSMINTFQALLRHATNIHVSNIWHLWHQVLKAACSAEHGTPMWYSNVVHQRGRQHAGKMTCCEAARFGGQVVQCGLPTSTGTSLGLECFRMDSWPSAWPTASNPQSGEMPRDVTGPGYFEA